jgi:hypothetical protein
MRRTILFTLFGGCATLVVLLSGSVAHAQGTRTGGTGGTGSGLGGGGIQSGGAGSSLSGGGTGGFLNSGTSGTGGFLNSGTGGTGGTGGFLNSGTGMGTTGTTMGGGLRGGGGTQGGVSTTNAFATTFINPMALGLPAGTSQPRFGSPLYTITSTTNAGGNLGASGFNRGGTATISGSNTVPTYPGASSIGVRRAPAYSTVLGFDYQPPSAARMHAQAREVIAKASRLESKDSILVALEGETLVLRGSTASDQERRLAESLIRLTPGVHDVRNELEVHETAPPPRRLP